MDRTERLAQIAALMGLTYGQAVALPLAVENAAAKVGMREELFIAELERNAELRAYLKQACVKADQEVFQAAREERAKGDTAQAREAAGEFPIGGEEG